MININKQKMEQLIDINEHFQGNIIELQNIVGDCK